MGGVPPVLNVPIKKIKSGMIVARPVCHSRSGVHYVQKGYALNRRTITRLTDLGVHSLWIECGELPEVDGKTNERVVERQEQLGQTLSCSIDQLRGRTDAVVDCSGFEEKVGGLLNDILDDPTHQPLLATMTGDCGALVRHLTNCCYLCLLIGTQLSGYVRKQRRKMPPHVAEDVQQLGMGAFVHDLGKTRLPDEAQDTHILCADAQDAAYRSHTTLGYELLRGQVSALAAHMIVHHHQRFDGKGFPMVKSRVPGAGASGLRGEKTHIFARILAVADAFDHLLGTPQDPKPTILALHALQQPAFAGWFDPVVVAALNRLMPPFMLGSVVTLTDGTRAVVVENHGDAPCRPTVRLLFGEPGMPGGTISDEAIDLRTRRRLNVGRVDGVNVRPFFFDPPEIPDGVMAYWGLRCKAIRSITVAPAASAPHDESVTSTRR